MGKLIANNFNDNPSKIKTFCDIPIADAIKVNCV